MAKLHLIGNAHLDPVWLWRWQEGFSEILNTFRSALDRMKEFPDFRFTCACAVYYEWVEKTDPAMFEEIRARVSEGRWSIVGGWFLQPDCNTPGGESFARHGLISQRYFMEKFGVAAETGYNVDSFGHNASLPQILRLSGMMNYVFMRPGPHENPNLHDAFVWESADGSRVAAYRIPESYCITSGGQPIDGIRARMEADGKDRMAFYGVGNHGGGPTVKLLRELEARGREDEIFSVPDDYFAALDTASLPTVYGELQHHARGCYSTVTTIKKGNRRCENNLLTAEAMCVMASRLGGMKYPAEKLRKAWKNLLFNQFHDILGGCSVKSAYDDAAMLHGEVMSITEQAIARAAAAVTRQIDTLCGKTLPCGKERENWHLWDADALGTPFVLFNPHPWQVTETVCITAEVEEIRDPAGDPMPVQRVRGEQTNGTDKYATAFTASVPAYGYAVYRLHHKGTAAPAAPAMTADERTLENSVIRVVFGEDGEIASFMDKRSGQAVISASCAAVLLDETDCDTWAHNKDSLGETVARFDRPTFAVIESGAVRATLRVTTRSGDSTIRRDYSISPDSDVLTVRMAVDFHEKHRALKLAFPAAGNVTAAIPYGSVVRAQNTGEEPCGAWLACGGLGFASDFACGYDSENGMLRPTVLRGAIYADHFGQKTRDEFCEYMDMGVGRFTYALFPYAGPADADRRARTLNAPLIPYSDSFHTGRLGQTFTGFSSDNDRIVVTAIKQAEDGTGNVIRFFDAAGADGRAALELLGDKLTAEYHHHEIKTFRTTGEETDLIERNQ